MIESIHVSEGDVILIRDPNGEIDADAPTDALHEAHPKSLVIYLVNDMTLETLPLDGLETMLSELIEHREAIRATALSRIKNGKRFET